MFKAWDTFREEWNSMVATPVTCSVTQWFEEELSVVIGLQILSSKPGDIQHVFTAILLTDIVTSHCENFLV